MTPSNDPEEILQNNYDDGGSVVNNKQVRAKVECVVEVNIDRDLVAKVSNERNVYLYKGNLDLNKHQHSIYTNPREEYPSIRKTSKAGATVNRVNRWNFGSSVEKPNIDYWDTVEKVSKQRDVYSWRDNLNFNIHQHIYQVEYPSSIQTPEVGATVNWANELNLRSSVEKPNSDWFLQCLVMYYYYYDHAFPPLISMYLKLQFLFFYFSCILFIILIILAFIKVLKTGHKGSVKVNKQNVWSSVEKPDSGLILHCLLMYYYYYDHAFPPLISMYLKLELFSCILGVILTILNFILTIFIMIFRKVKIFENWAQRCELWLEHWVRF